MSTAAGLAAVTAVLKDLLSNGLIDRDVVGAVGDVIISTSAPDRITLPETVSQLNLYLYLVSRNQGWANVGQPSRATGGELISAPPLPLNLHYLLTAYGAKDFHAEILLGYAMQLLHETPVLTRPAIRTALGPNLVVADGDIPANLRDLVRSGLADQIEQVTITQNFLTTEAMSNLWLAFSAPYRPTASYLASVVLIESDRQGSAAPPVRAFTVGARTLRRPVIDQIKARPATGTEFSADRRIRRGDIVALLGRQLRGDRTQLFVGDVQVTEGLSVTDALITFTVPGRLPAGIHPIHVVHLLDMGLPPTPHAGVESNTLPMVLHPTVTSVTATLDPPAGGSGPAPRAGTLTVAIDIPAAAEQRLTVMLNEFDPPQASVRNALAYRFAIPVRVAGPPASTVSAPFVGVMPAEYLVRLRVDGAESPLGTSAANKYDSPRVVIP